MKSIIILLLAVFALMVLPIFAAHADITFAVVGPLTGQDAATGEQMQRGANAVQASINAAGGLLGQKLQLVYKDDACDPKQAVAIANELGGETIAAVIGPMCSGAAIPASKIFNEEGLLMITPSATSPLLTEQGFDNIFRTYGRDDQQAAVIIDLIAKRFHDKNIAIVQDKTAYGQGLAEAVRAGLAQHGIKEKLYESITRGERDYSSLLSKLKQNAIDVVFFGGYHTEAGLIVRQMRDQNMPAVFIGDDDLTTREFWVITGDAGEGALMSFGADPRQRPEAAAAVKQIRASGFDPEGTTLYTYAAIQVVAAAMQRAGATATPKVIAALHQGSYPTVLGNLTFDPKGDVAKPDYIMYRWSKGNYAPLEGQ